MPFDLVGTLHQMNDFGATFDVPMIMNPMIYEDVDCTFSQDPKNTPLYDDASVNAASASAPAWSAMAAAAAAAVAGAAIILQTTAALE